MGALVVLSVEGRRPEYLSIVGGVAMVRSLPARSQERIRRIGALLPATRNERQCGAPTSIGRACPHLKNRFLTNAATARIRTAGGRDANPHVMSAIVSHIVLTPRLFA